MAKIPFQNNHQAFMEKITINFFNFLKNPQEKFNEILSLKEKWNILFSILVLDFILVTIASGITSLIDLHLFELKSDPLEELFSNKAAFYIIIVAALIVPLIEEFIFRLFLNYEMNKSILSVVIFLMPIP